MFYEWSRRTMAEIFDYTCSEFGDRPALAVDGHRLDYSELHERVVETARRFEDIGIGHGSRVAAILQGSLEFAETVLALQRLGAVLIPLNLSWTAREYVQAFQLTDPDVLIATEDFRGNSVLDGLETELSGFADSEPGRIQVDEVPSLHTVIAVRSVDRPYAFSYEAVRDPAVALPAPQTPAVRRAPEVDTPVLTLPTSGSTGFPKPVIHSHNSFLVQCATYADGTEIGPEDRLLNYGTTYHASGQLLFFLPFIRGASQVLVDWFSAPDAMETIERERITVTWGFDAHFLMMRRDPSFPARDLTSMRCALIGSDPGTFEEVAQLGFPSFANIYGCSEYLSNLFPYRERADVDRMARTHGRPMEGVVQKIVDPATGEVTAPGVIGEICVRGPGLFKGYYGMPEETAAAFDEDGFFHTGDLGYVDEDGYTYYRGRIKDVVKTGGENVSAREIELFLQTEIPGVRVAQVFGVPDPKWGEAVTAMVELDEGAELSEVALREQLRGRLAGYKIPKRVFFVGADDWVITPTGKLDKTAMRSRVLEQLV